MSEQTETPKNAENADKAQSPLQERSALVDLRGVFIAAAWCLVGVALIAIFWPNLPQRMAFFIGIFFNLMIAFAVVAQVIIYRKQWRVMRLQWHEANRQAKSSAQLIELMVMNECAYVRIGTIDIEQPDGNSVKMEGTFINGGRTPAWNFRRHLQLAVIDPGEEYHPTLEVEEADAPSVIVANTPPTKFHCDAIRLSDEDAEKVRRGDRFVVLNGVCRYDDSLGGRVYYRFGFDVVFEDTPRCVERYQTYYREKANPN